jgi:hypothetical protein
MKNKVIIGNILTLSFHIIILIIGSYIAPSIYLPIITFAYVLFGYMMPYIPNRKQNIKSVSAVFIVGIITWIIGLIGGGWSWLYFVGYFHPWLELINTPPIDQRPIITFLLVFLPSVLFLVGIELKLLVKKKFS